MTSIDVAGKSVLVPVKFNNTYVTQQPIPAIQLTCKGLLVERLTSWLVTTGTDHTEHALQPFGHVSDSGTGVVAHRCTGSYTFTCKLLCCTECAAMWEGKRGGRTQGSGKGPLNVFITNATNVDRDTVRTLPHLRADQKRLRRQTAARTKRASEALCELRTCLKSTLSSRTWQNLTPAFCEFLETVSSIDRQGHLSPTFYKLAEAHFRNSWRTGTQVHGKRYQKSSPTIDAASIAHMKGQHRLCAMLSANAIASLPSKKTVARHTSANVEVVFGVQPRDKLQLQHASAMRRPNGAPARCSTSTRLQLLDVTHVVCTCMRTLPEFSGFRYIEL